MMTGFARVGGTAVRILGVAGMVIFSASPIWAGSSWYSRAETLVPGGSVSSTASGTATLNAASAQTVFSLSISLEENPAGDDVYPADSGVGDDAQNAFERRIEAFADAVYQSTNGRHKIGTVTMFRNRDHWTQADVQWVENCVDFGPHTWVNGFTSDLYNIVMCTNWAGGDYALDVQKGQALAHEWGHYAYGVFDEYQQASCDPLFEYCFEFQPTQYDTPSVPSIMTFARNATTSGNQDWLEFSTLGVEPFLSQADGNDENAQARVFGEPAWATLTRDPATDPKYLWLDTERTQYTTLVAPTASDYFVTNSLADARSELNIVWAGNISGQSGVVWEMMVDTSASMLTESKLDNAKTVVNDFIDQITPGDEALGVGVFQTEPFQIFSIMDIPDPDPGEREAAKAYLGAWVAEGGTDIQAAALSALGDVQNFDPGSRLSAVLLLTDGRSTVDVNRVATAYNAAGVPLFPIGFGSGVDSAVLNDLAAATGGQYYFIASPGLAQAQQAFSAVKAAVSSSVIVSSGSATSAPNSTALRPIVLDSGLDMATVTASYARDAADIGLRLLDRSGAKAATFACTQGAEVSCVSDVDVAASGAGTYTLEIVNRTTGAKDIAVLVSAEPVLSPERMDIAVKSDDANYPESFTISAMVRKGLPLTGLDVTAKVETPNGILEVSLLDDGLNSDGLPDDGRYTAVVPYTEDGSYSAVVTASNAPGQAQTTIMGVLAAHGSLETAYVPVNVTEAFTRVAVKTALVAGVAWDDHADAPDVAALCTRIADDNIDTVGRIDTEGDTDCFYLSPSSPGADLVARVSSLSAGMAPVLRVYDATGTVELVFADLSTHENVAGGISVAIPTTNSSGLDYVVTVEHQDATADVGGYAVSVGAALVSDKRLGSGSGGALGPGGLFVAALLALVGLRQRRREEVAGFWPSC